MLSLFDEKARLRSEIKGLRIQPNEAERARASLHLSHALWPFLENQAAPIAVYLARPFELSLDPLIEILLESNVEICAPHLDLERETMTFVRLQSLQDVCNGPWNVREPRGNEVVAPSLVIVPGLAFDPRGHRLGTGGGWYDRTLTPAMTTVGVGFDFQIVARVPVEAHDCTMNWVFSNKRKFGPFGD